MCTRRLVCCHHNHYVFTRGLVCCQPLRVSVSQCSVCRNHNPALSSFMTYHRVCNKSDTTGVTCGAWPVHPSGAPEFTPVFSWVRVAESVVFCVMFCRSLFVLLYFFFWPLCCLSFGHCVVCLLAIVLSVLRLWLLITTQKTTTTYVWLYYVTFHL